MLKQAIRRRPMKANYRDSSFTLTETPYPYRNIILKYQKLYIQINAYISLYSEY